MWGRRHNCIASDSIYILCDIQNKMFAFAVQFDFLHTQGMKKVAEKGPYKDQPSIDRV